MIKLVNGLKEEVYPTEHKGHFVLACMCTGKFSYLHKLNNQDITLGFKTFIETISAYSQTLRKEGYCESLIQSINTFPDNFATAVTEWIEGIITPLKVIENNFRIYELQSLLDEYKNNLNTYTIKTINQKIESYTQRKNLLYENITILFALHPLLSSQNLCRVIKTILSSAETRAQTEKIFEKITRGGHNLTIKVPEEVIKQLAINQVINLLEFAIETTIYTEYPLFIMDTNNLKQKLVAVILTNPYMTEKIQQNLNNYKILSEYNSVKRYYQALANIEKHFWNNPRKLILSILNSDIPDKDKPLILYLFVAHEYDDLSYKGNQVETLRLFQERNITESWINTVERKILNYVDKDEPQST